MTNKVKTVLAGPGVKPGTFYCRICSTEFDAAEPAPVGTDYASYDTQLIVTKCPNCSIELRIPIEIGFLAMSYILESKEE